jgi:hypothetical protein
LKHYASSQFWRCFSLLPAEIQVLARCNFALSALVFGDEALLGAVPMEMMDLVLQPSTQSLTVNPESPYIPVAFAK